MESPKTTTTKQRWRSPISPSTKIPGTLQSISSSSLRLPCPPRPAPPPAPPFRVLHQHRLQFAAAVARGQRVYSMPVALLSDVFGVNGECRLKSRCCAATVPCGMRWRETPRARARARERERACARARQRERERKRERERREKREMCASEREWPGSRGTRQGGTARQEKSESCIAVIHGDLPPNASLSHWCKRTGVLFTAPAPRGTATLEPLLDVLHTITPGPHTPPAFPPTKFDKRFALKSPVLFPPPNRASRESPQEETGIVGP